MKQKPFDVVVLSSVDWNATWQRHHVFSEQWAKTGHRVFFVENTGSRKLYWRDLNRIKSKLKDIFFSNKRILRSPVDGIEVLSPLVLPPSNYFFRLLNQWWLTRRIASKLRSKGLSNNHVVFAYLPTATTLQIIQHLLPTLVVYDCVDNFKGVKPPLADLEANESNLTARADLVLTTSRTLYNDKKDLHPHVIELHHGVSAPFFLSPRTAAGPHFRFAYFGTIWNVLDYDAIIALAEAGFDISLIGPVKDNTPTLPESVRMVGPLAHSLLPNLLNGMDGLLLPYIDSDYNRGVIPAKIYECLATGRPVLSSPLPALVSLPQMKVLKFCKTPQEWVSQARRLDAEDSPATRQARIDLAKEHSTEKAFGKLASLVDELLIRR